MEGGREKRFSALGIFDSRDLLLVQLHRYKHDVDEYECKLLQLINLHCFTIWMFSPVYILVKNHFFPAPAMDLK